MAALVESPPLRSQTSSPVHSVQGSTATFGHGRVSFDLHTPPSVLKQHQQQSQQQYSSTDHTVSAPVTSDLTTNRTTIPELNVNGTAVISPEPRPRKASTASNARGDAGAAGGKEGESQWGANFWVTLIEPQSQTPFYACPATGEVSWDPPVGNFVLPPSTEGEWWELVDESRNLPYYYHTKTNETVWERPDGFVIPLGILQNTALCRRLSARYSQVFDDTTNFTIQTDTFGSVRRNETGANTNGTRSRRSSQHSIPDVQTRRYSQSFSGQGKRSSSDGQHRHHVSGMQSNLPPIPASPYATEGSSPPSPSNRVPPKPLTKEYSKESISRAKGKQRELVFTDEDDALVLAHPQPQDTTIPRARSKSASGAPYRAPIPQSLDAAAELLAHYPRSGPDSPTVERGDAFANTNGATSAMAPQRKFSASSAYSQTTGTDMQSLLVSSNGVTASPRVFFSPQETSSPPRVTSPSLSLSIERGSPPSVPAQGQSHGASVGANLLRKRSKSRERAPPSPRRPVPPTPQGTTAPPLITTKDIGEPRLDAEATYNLSPVKARAGGKPILLEPKHSQSISTGKEPTRYSTGGRPVLPDDLASDIQQFVQTEFARQYFSTHRTGFIFRRKVPVERMMMWQKTPISSPLLVLNRSLHKDAVKIFKVIQRIMGDRDRDRPVGVRQASDNHITSLASAANASSTSLPSMMNGILEEERWLLSEGLTHGELRDEIYCQLVKQLTGNSNPESLFRGWQLMCVLLVTFPPSKNFEAYLRSFMQHRTAQTEGRVDVIAKYCLQRLAVIAKKGPRGKPPTTAEIETASDAAFNPSTFGETIDAVIRLQERTYPHLQVPIILPFLADGILALGGTKSEGIFRIPGDGDIVSELKIRIERGYYNLEGVDDPHVPASLLKLWLRELCDPLVPTELYNDCVACSRDPEACVQMVARLPTYNRRVMLFVISFLQLFLDEKVQSITKMTAPNLALVMAPNLLRCASDSMTVVFTNAPYEQSFVLNLLVHLKCNKIDPDYVPKHGLGSTVTSPPINKGSKSRGRRVPR